MKLYTLDEVKDEVIGNIKTPERELYERKLQSSLRPNIFHFRQFTINQSGAAMKVGTDGMILGAYVQPEKAERILDIGTGTGLLALMMAQKSDAKIDAIEIDEKAYQLAKENFENSPWKNKLTAIHASLQTVEENNQRKYGIVISNPPYFENAKEGNNPIKMVKTRATARTTDSLPLEDLAKCIAKLLATDGKLYVILPSQSADIFISLASENNLHLLEKLSIKSRTDTKIIRTILGFGFGKPLKVIESEFIIYDAINQYSKEYIELTKEYHSKDFSNSD